MLRSAGMDWDDLRIFLAVARDETLSAAGQSLRLDPATVGRRVRRLEEHLGARLFTRSPQGYQLSSAGARLLEHTERIEQSVLQGQDALSGQAERLSGQVRIGAPDGCANFLLPQVCAAISEQNPQLEIQIVALPRVINLSKREADMAITVSPPSSSRLDVRKVTDYHLHLAAHRDYLKDARPINRLEDLQQHRVIGYIPDMIFDRELDYLGKAGIERVQLASNSVSVQMQMIREKAGIGIVHDFALPRVSGVERILLNAFSLKRSFYLVRHADDARFARFNQIASLLADGLRGEVARLEACV